MQRTVAVIDVGSNSVRLLVARQLSGSAFEVVDEERYDARLGQGQVDGNISTEGLERGMRALRITSEVARGHEPEITVVAGTEALRRAPNASTFVRKVRSELGLEVRILSAEEEARASFLGAMNSTTVENGHLVDIGGGSLEVVRIENREPVGVQSVPLGALYASERYLLDDPPTARQVRALRKAVNKMITIEGKLPVLVGAGGAVRNLARLHRLRSAYPLRRLHGMEIPARDLHRMSTQLAGAPVTNRRKMPGVSPNRVETLHAAAIVIDEVARMSGADHMLVAGQGLREGLLWQAIRPGDPLLPDVRRASIEGLTRANGVEEHRLQPVLDVATYLFDATTSLHGFGNGERELLLSAAQLAEIGMHVDYYNRDRHAEYLVHAGDLHGFTHREIAITAALVRSADSGSPSLGAYAALLQPEDERRASSLSVLLGLARAIHRRRPSPVSNVTLKVDKSGRGRLTITSDEPLDAEVHALESQARRYEAVFRAPLLIGAKRTQPANARKAAG